MKKIYGFGDTETTGTDYVDDQILDYASVFMEKNTILEEINHEIVLKNNTIPNPKALLVNNLNPFTDEYKSKSLSEYKAVNLFIDEVNKYKKDPEVGSVLFMYYNAPFDVQMFESAFKRCGKDFNKLVPIVFDLYILAKHLIDKGVLKTKKTDFGFSGKLGDVYEGLGFSKSSMEAHNALGDTVILPAVANKLYMLFNGKEISDIDIDPSTFEELSIQSIVFVTPLSLSRSRSLQLINKTFLILKNDVENRELHVIDSEKLTSVSIDLNKATEIIHYSQVFDETLIDTTKTKICQKYILDNRSVLDKYISNLKIENKDDSLDLPDFHKVINLCEKIRSLTKLTQADIDSLSDEEKSLLDQAEQYSYSKYNGGWTSTLKGSYHKDDIKTVYSIKNLNIQIDPVKGEFLVQNKDDNKIEFSGTTKSVVLKYLVDKQVIENKTEDYKSINNILSQYKDIKNEKALINILEEFNKEKMETFNGANKLHKEILTSLLSFYKLHYPKIFNEVKMPSFSLNLAGLKKK